MELLLVAALVIAAVLLRKGIIYLMDKLDRYYKESIDD
jgi:hypothetical protein